MKSLSEIKSEDVVSIHQFGSSVEGKENPNDIDLFVIVKDGKYKFKKTGGLNKPYVFDEGKKQYFVMPETDGEDLLNTMLYTGKKDPDRQHSGTRVRIR
jgi:predicted nucleotidyltransferase